MVISIRCVNIDINVQPKEFTAKGTTAADAIFKFTANFKPPPPPKKIKISENYWILPENIV